ncbi:hypothetical protein PPERSA_02422 [Pseudocohnilembus persalinus]|uniref:EF-hand domain-containing protein n=1 Tax=Pseudocohnilembus persalinus TaxID=266149 RepID=A0A0V0QAS1_PSEPJ|nr:hypothetical protein PPERSA_02422 [Pseudocohnilembus persalinus]|eukprot:KRW99310.1 hypothetical protein PPERSA_02422 [Pseudocohnilembus persalinus]
MSQYGVGLNVELKAIINQFKLHIAKQTGKVTVRNLRQIFNNFDANRNYKLEPEEFEKALGAFGFFLKKYQYQAIFNAFDQNKDGAIDYNEFLSALREPLSERRLKLVLKVYDQLDTNNNGFVDTEDIQKNYDVSHNEEFQKGKKSAEDIKHEFISNFNINQQGKIDKREFIAYYEDLSVAIPSDNYFVEVIKNTWGVNEDVESNISEQEVKNIIKIIRFKLIQSTNGMHDEFLLRRLFESFDTNKSGCLSIDELYAMTIKLEIPIHKKYLAPLMKKFDRNNSGYVDFDEFSYFVTYDPYP